MHQQSTLGVGDEDQDALKVVALGGWSLEVERHAGAVGAQHLPEPVVVVRLQVRPPVVGRLEPELGVLGGVEADPRLLVGGEDAAVEDVSADRHGVPRTGLLVDDGDQAPAGDHLGILGGEIEPGLLLRLDQRGGERCPAVLDVAAGEVPHGRVGGRAQCEDAAPRIGDQEAAVGGGPGDGGEVGADRPPAGDAQLPAEPLDHRSSAVAGRWQGVGSRPPVVVVVVGERDGGAVRHDAGEDELADATAVLVGEVQVPGVLQGQTGEPGPLGQLTGRAGRHRLALLPAAARVLPEGRSDGVRGPADHQDPVRCVADHDADVDAFDAFAGGEFGEYLEVDQ